MKTLRLVLGDQLSRSLSALRDLDRAHDVVLVVEARDELTHVRHHRQKIALLLAALRHFAAGLAAEGIRVDHMALDAPGNRGSVDGELDRALARHSPDRVVVTEPGEWRQQELLRAWADGVATPVEVRADDRFFCSRADFAAWAEGRAHPRMEHFYRHMRRRTGWLMDGERPEGGRWNYDRENRKRLPRDLAVPGVRRVAPDATTREVLALVEREFPGHFGDLEPFGWAVTREEAQRALDDFVAQRLPGFGEYQDAMKTGEDFLFHSALSPYLNIGLLTVREVCEAALAARRRTADDDLDDDADNHADDRAEGRALGPPLAAVEGFVRQTLGWREYVRGLYWQHSPAYAASNFFEARRPLPSFYWTGATDMRCLREAVTATRRTAYAHHIQRLMLTGNYALLAGVAPAEVEEWYLIVYADAFEWVELPNTHGMALYADGGLLASKPYAASGAYIDRMSDYCAGCVHDPKVKLGPGACPFNVLYWRFLIVNQDRLAANPRMGLPYRSLARMTEGRRRRIVMEGDRFLDGRVG